MRILLLAHSFNSLTQRLWVELTDAGHEVSLEFDVRDSVTVEAVRMFRPELVIAPFLKRAIPEGVWREHRCIVIHPGIEGDRGPSALDWAVLEGEARWGVTALQANAEMDAGDVWASVGFDMRCASKGSLYRNEVTEAAVEAVRLTLARIAAGVAPVPLDYTRADVRGRLRPPMRQADRAIDWERDDSATVLR
jgi:putative two-component system hydrogenase maturation factor HypX/HoxX